MSQIRGPGPAPHAGELHRDVLPTFEAELAAGLERGETELLRER